MVLGPEHIHGRPAPGAKTPEDCGIYLAAADLRADYASWTAQGVILDGVGA